MRRPGPKALALTEEEWEECRAAALETFIATGVRVPTRQVAVEYARAREHDARVAPPPFRPIGEL